MHKEILTENQIDLLPLISKFSKDYYLVGGTAIALYLGHRRSIDFDLFTCRKVKRKSIKNILYDAEYSDIKFGYEDSEQLHFYIHKVKVTFFSFPYKIESPVNFEKTINFPALIDLSAMKAFALGGRAKWKDYVDLFFLLKHHFLLQEIINRAKILFGDMFSEKLFRGQLSFFKDIDYSEPIEYIVPPVDEKEIKDFLIEVALTPF
ncbi:MAG: nucleotidyl transferase AbiEii/AbiGii toxin family protein [Bacteroidia bacterium]|nr:nucleotidyl transferase AbiEii/AbiGii toxin family protein [Bacteroidia bacterium]